MDCSKNEGAVAGLPDDPLLEILSRVPAKSVCRFKCVSKAWRDLIADPHHRKKLPQAMQGLFFMVPEDSFSVSFSFIDLTTGPVPLDIDPAFSFLTERPGFQFQNLGLLDSCNGLILFKNHQEPPYSDAVGYVVCNPTTKRWQAVPTCGSLDLTTCAYLAFDQAISSHFHLVQFQISMADEMLVSLHAYSSETGTWSRNQIDSQENQGPLAEWHDRAILSRRDPECAFVNGFLHFIVGDSDQHQIVVVDVQGKARRMITVPGVADGRHRYCYLAQSQGCLHYMTQEMCDAHEERYKLSIWVLQNYDTQEWVLKDTVSSLEIFGHLTSDILHFIVGIHQDCNVVFFSQPCSSKLIAYDMDHKENPQLSQISTGSMCSIYELLAAWLNTSRLRITFLWTGHTTSYLPIEHQLCWCLKYICKGQQLSFSTTVCGRPPYPVAAASSRSVLVKTATNMRGFLSMVGNGIRRNIWYRFYQTWEYNRLWEMLLSI